MKTTICAEELRELEACEDGYDTFYEAHGESVVKLSEALESNSLEDVFWLLNKLKLAKQQKDDLHLLSCTYAEEVLHFFEEAHPDDSRPRKAIEAKKAWLAGKVSDEELEAARGAASEAAWADSEAAWAAWAAWAAASATRAAALVATSEAACAAAREAASEAASEAARAAARAAAWGAARGKQKEQLRQVLLTWESVQWPI